MSKTYYLPEIFLFSLVFTAYEFQQYEKKQDKSKLEKLVDENKNGKLDSYEKIRMYNLCGLKDTTEYLSTLDLENGIKNYKKLIKNKTILE